MSLKFITFSALMLLPIFAFGLSASDEYIVKHSDMIFEGTVCSISTQVSFQKTDFITSHVTNAIPCLSARVLVKNVLKGVLSTDSMVDVYYEKKPPSVERCPPYVTIKKGDTGTISAKADFSNGSLKLFIPSGEFFKLKNEAQKKD